MRSLFISGIVAIALLLLSSVASAVDVRGQGSLANPLAGIADGDWQAIRVAHEAAQRNAVANESGVGFRHEGQGWTVTLDGSQFLIHPDSGAWSFGLRLESYGGAVPVKMIGRTTPVAAGTSVRYPWDARLTEWFKNESGGLEHGYTVQTRPADVHGLLIFEWSVLGNLHPLVAPDGFGIHLFDRSESHVLNYSGLKVFDATGAMLPARFEWSGARLRLEIDEKTARYPLTIDPIAQQAYLKASNTGANDQFGYAVAVWGNTVAVSAIAEASNATGINGNQANNSTSSAGAVYIFVRNAGVWTQQAYVKASNTGINDQFGFSLALSGDTLVVGALSEDSNATGVNGIQSNNSAPDSGALYVFVRNAGVWSQQAYIKQSNTNSGDLLGYSVAISGDTIVAGAVGEGSSATGVNGNQLDNSLTNAGAVYVYVRAGTSWSQQAYLKASNTDPFDQFGYAVSVSGDTLVVGAYLEDSSTTGINGSGANNGAADSGAVYVFVRSAGTWTQQAYVKASNTGASDTFGSAVVISGDTLVVGANAEDSNAMGVNGNQLDNSLTNAGAVYIFIRSAGSWTQQAYLKASNPDASDLFGYSLALSGDLLAIGAFGEASNAAGFNGNQSNNSTPNAGAVYLFIRAGSIWSQQTYIKASNTETLDFFGVSVGLSGELLVVGASLEDSSAAGINGHQNFNNASSAGAAYAFDIGSSLGLSSFGTGTPGCSGTHTLGANQAPVLNSPNFAITCDNAPATSLGLGLVGDVQDIAGSDPVNFGVLLHCDLVLSVELLTLDFISNGFGYSETVSAAIPNDNALIGKTYFACVLWAWPLATCTLPGFNPFNLSTSRGLAITIQQP